jgi:predicted nucleic acid-binding protein
VRIVLDADVLIGALDGSDSHHARARAFFTEWEERGDTRLISVVNLTEVLVAPAAERERLRVARQAIAALGVAIHQPGALVGVEAARLRSAHPISLPDAYCLATANHVGGSVASFDEKILRAARSAEIPLASTPARRKRLNPTRPAPTN